MIFCANALGSVAVTNVRRPPEREGLSRGELVAHLVRDDAPAAQALASLAPVAPGYRPFNLLMHDGDTLAYASNLPDAPPEGEDGRRFAMRPLAPGVHGMSNGALDAPWPKTAATMSCLDAWLASPAAHADADGWMYVITLHEADFRALCVALEVPEVANDPRFATSELRYQHTAALTARLAEAFARQPTDVLSERFKRAGLMHARVNDYLELLRDPHVEATGIVTWIDHPGVGRVPIPRAPGLRAPESGSTRAIAPSLDQHRKEILAEIGLA